MGPFLDSSRQAARFIEWRERASDPVVHDHPERLGSGRAADIARVRQHSGRAHQQPTRSGCHCRPDPIFRCWLYWVSSYCTRFAHSVIDSARCYPTTIGHCSSSRCRRLRIWRRRQAGNLAKPPGWQTATWRASRLSLRLWVPPPSPATEMRSPTGRMKLSIAAVSSSHPPNRFVVSPAGTPLTFNYLD